MRTTLTLALVAVTLTGCMTGQPSAELNKVAVQAATALKTSEDARNAQWADRLLVNKRNEVRLAIQIDLAADVDDAV